MLLIETILLAVGLSMDSLAVSVAGGAVMRHCPAGSIMRIAAVMGLFQAGFAALGYAAGWGFQQEICSIDHWIAFALLTYLGGKMIVESRKKEEDQKQTQLLRGKNLCTLAVATSIDALAVGISLALLQEPLLPLTLTIGIVTFLFSASGVLIGSRCGERSKLPFDLIGGIILIAIGTKILLEHLYLEPTNCFSSL